MTKTCSNCQRVIHLGAEGYVVTEERLLCMECGAKEAAKWILSAKGKEKKK